MGLMSPFLLLISAHKYAFKSKSLFTPVVIRL